MRLPLPLLLALAVTALGTDPVASVTGGRISGYVDQGILVFKGVPYGTARRFEAPEPPTAWSAVRDATHFGPMAPQTHGRTHGSDPFFPQPAEGTPMSEDCLVLNVWTPALHDGGKRPVIVYLHGGAYNDGSSDLDLYDGVSLCRRGNAVVITVNHRLNVFGFLYLAPFGGPADSGNAGMLDLVQVLRWIKGNAPEFGGDPGNVTIFGQSGGGAKCATLMAMPLAHGLFHRVMTMSGQQLTGRTREHATQTTRAVLAALGITPGAPGWLDALRQVPMDRLLAAARGQMFAPVVDGRALPRDPFSPDASPLSWSIPMILGNTHDETTYLIGGGDPEAFHLTWETLPGHLQHAVAPFIGKLDPARIVRDYRSWYPAYSPSDVFFAATTAARSWKGLVVESERRTVQGFHTWVYEFDWKTPVFGGAWKAPHTLDIPFFFDNLRYAHSMVGDPTPAAEHLAQAMADTLIAFARTGTPVSPALPRWPRFTTDARVTMVFDTSPHVAEDPRGKERKLFAPVPYVQPGT